ncbi:hypothetical protein NQK81_01085 [Amycolatopsis roodepoortensis]|uniref:hypothetical protein n=1 Tax=Amycolatopsis roodepoortensis TaxID=700274 RepID=UPI00214CA91B|nr:hypothetical protein [Amycolatopsis roodepoortensis]UUV32068.1 hypothetical protein NQK81_01085 [Amycolatopsis roodepoortensis]
MNRHYPPRPGNSGPPNQYRQQGNTPPVYPPQYQHFPGSQMPPRVPPKKRRRRLKITLALLVVAIVALGGVITVRAWMSPSASGKTPADADLGSGSVTDPIRYTVNIPAGESKHYPTDLPGIPAGAELTDQQLGGIDPRTLLWVTLHRQAQRPVTDLVNRWYPSIDEYEKSYPGAHSAIRSAIDWRTREFTRDDVSIDADNKIETYLIFRCVGSASGPAREGTYHQARSGDRAATWKVVENPPASNCPDRMKPGKVVANNHVTDGLAPYGLSPQETDKFISYLDHVPDLLQVDRPETITGTDGKRYVQLDVTLVPQPDGMNDRKGAAFLNAAFAQTGKSPFDQPYSINIGAYQGFKKRYFLDPSTLLPSYSVTLSTPRLDLGGAPVTTGPQPEIAYNLDQYAWPDTIDSDAKRTEGGPPVVPHKAWPFEKIRLHG